jgi:hypothetical protein
MRTTNFFISIKSPHLSQGNVKQERCHGRQRLTGRIRSKTQPENRLWKLSMEAASFKSRKLEMIACLFFGILASAAAVYCGTELFPVVSRDALEQTVQAILTR